MIICCLKYQYTKSYWYSKLAEWRIKFMEDKESKKEKFAKFLNLLNFLIF